MHSKRNAVTAGRVNGKRRSIRERGGQRQRTAKKNGARETVEAVLIALIAAMLLRAFVVQAFRIPTGSMKDTLLVGDFLLVNKFVYGVRTPDRIPLIDAEIPFFRLPAFKAPKNGDVVVFKYPENEKLDYIKRCIAVGGQTIEIKDGVVYIDGVAEGEMLDMGQKFDPAIQRYVQYTHVKTPYGKSYTIRHFSDSFNKTETFGPKTVPEGHYFMMGDNRDNSSDSRVWGFVPEENIVGEALVIYFSWDTARDWWSSIRWTRLARPIR